jgi:hypothetical protein
MTDHDQRFKLLLKEFPAEFFGLFFPEWAERFDFDRIEWLDQEVFPDPPEGRRRSLDLVAKLPTREPVGDQTDKPPSAWISLIHVEVGSADSATAQREYMFRSYTNLRDRHGLPVLPVALYLRVGLKGIGIDVYREKYGTLDVVTFKFLYVGLPALDAVQYLEKGSDLGVALAALMRVPKDRRARFKAEALERLAKSEQNELRKYLLSGCVETYLPLETPEEQEEFERLLATEEFEEAKTMATTFYEQGLEEGRIQAKTMATTFYEQGLQQGMEQGEVKGQRKLLALQVEGRFGPLSPEIRERLEQWPADRLTELGQKILHAESLSELGLED